jgi:hypothetical protein
VFKLGYFLLRCFIAGFLGLALISSPLASDDHSNDYQSQKVAELILGIIHFSRWPDSVKNLQLCIVGETDHTEFILNTELMVGDYVIDSKWVDDAHLLDETGTCQVLFFGDYDTKQINSFYAQLYGSPVLTIDELNEDCRVGGMFCLHDKEGKLGFKVNLDAVGRSQVRIHPGVLRLGQRRVTE